MTSLLDLDSDSDSMPALEPISPLPSPEPLQPSEEEIRAQERYRKTTDRALQLLLERPFGDDEETGWFLQTIVQAGARKYPFIHEWDLKKHNTRGRGCFRGSVLEWVLSLSIEE